ncbi:MAG: hypothetical protein LBE21_05550 [Pseudomonadales bacterium]|nr:hypothetical protein [Pseudomonadales bacterium]
MSEPSNSENAACDGDLPALPADLDARLPWANDSAEEEDKSWGDLDAVRRTNDKRWLMVYGWVLVVLTITFTATFLCTLVVWAWHYLTPWPWLTDAQLDKIQSVLFSGGMGAVISGIVRAQMEKIRRT